MADEEIPDEEKTETQEIRIVVIGEINSQDSDETTYHEMVEIARSAGEALVEHAAFDVFRIEIEFPDGKVEVWDAAGRAGFESADTTVDVRRGARGEIGHVDNDNESAPAPMDAPPEPREDSGEIPEHDQTDSVETDER